jgi:Xaa-Pro aminopeptidase
MNAVLSRGGKPAFALIRIGRNGISGQAEPDATKLRRGEFVWFDVGCTYRGYWADIARVASLGEPSAHLSKVYEAMRRGQEAGIERALPGADVADLFECVVGTIRASGVPGYRRHHVGHGVGLEVYDEPMLSPGRDDALEAGMVVNVETPYYEFGFGAVNVEDPILVSADGPRRLSDYPDALRVV